MARKKADRPKRNAVAVRFDDEELALVERAAGEALVSPWVRDAAVEKARKRTARARTGGETKAP